MLREGQGVAQLMLEEAEVVARSTDVPFPVSPAHSWAPKDSRASELCTSVQLQARYLLTLTHLSAAAGTVFTDPDSEDSTRRAQ